jgi:hypothetical protein
MKLDNLVCGVEFPPFSPQMSKSGLVGWSEPKNWVIEKENTVSAVR